MSNYRDDERVARSAHGVKAVRRVTRVANGALLHAIDVDVLPGPGWADLSSDSHATLSIVLETIGGKVENRVELDRPPRDGTATMIFAPKGTPIWGCSRGVRRVRELRVDFDLPRLSEALNEKIVAPLAPRLLRDERLRYLARSLAAECTQPESFSQLYIDSLTAVLCIDFLRLTSSPRRASGRLAPSRLRCVTDYISEHLPEAVKLEELAALAGLSQSQFARAFKASTGLSPHRWQLDARIARAKELLVSGSLPQSRIALDTGFADQSHFCRVFRRIEGTSPGVWQADRGGSAE